MRMGMGMRMRMRMRMGEEIKYEGRARKEKKRKGYSGAHVHWRALYTAPLLCLMRMHSFSSAGRVLECFLDFGERGGG